MEKKYKVFPLRGCCQGDYVELIAPEDTDRDFIEEIEALYFNLGSEVEIDDTDREDIDNPDDICGYTFYTKYYDADDIKNVIAANYTDITPDDIKLWLFDGYTKTAKYQVK